MRRIRMAVEAADGEALGAAEAERLVYGNGAWGGVWVAPPLLRAFKAGSILRVEVEGAGTTACPLDGSRRALQAAQDGCYRATLHWERELARIEAEGYGEAGDCPAPCGDGCGEDAAP